jgi:hypothetical protein
MLGHIMIVQPWYVGKAYMIDHSKQRPVTTIDTTNQVMDPYVTINEHTKGAYW